MEEDLIVKKNNHDIAMDTKRMKLEEQKHIDEVALEHKRLELEILREKRLEEESKRRDEFMLTMCSMFKQFQSIIEKKS